MVLIIEMIFGSFLFLGGTVSPPSTLYIYYTLLIYINQLFLTKKPAFSDFFIISLLLNLTDLFERAIVLLVVL